MLSVVGVAPSSLGDFVLIGGLQVDQRTDEQQHQEEEIGNIIEEYEAGTTDGGDNI